MKVGVFLVRKHDPAHYVAADGLVRSVRRVMPDVEIVHFTDETSPGIYGADEVRRRPKARMAVLRMEHEAACEGDWLFLDTDVLIQHDVSRVFDASFDVAIAARPAGSLEGPGEHNFGVVFSRCPAFWRAILDRLRILPDEQQTWMGDQIAGCDVIRSKAFNVHILPPAYNYAPETPEDTPEDVTILHYKGPRKRWLLERLRREALCPSA